jgi:hypothetical protein
MHKKIVSIGVGVLLLSCLGAVPAQAAAVRPLRLAQYAVTISAPPEVPRSVCNGGSELNCGTVAVQATFSGLAGRARPTSPGAPVVELAGSVDVTRTYGCAAADGRRLQRLDQKVTERLRLGTRRSSGLTVPPTGDTTTGVTYAFLPDSQPRQCPAGTTPMVYSIAAKGVRLELLSRWAPIPSKDYSAPGRARWDGAAPNPVAAPVPVPVPPAPTLVPA